MWKKALMWRLNLILIFVFLASSCRKDGHKRYSGDFPEAIGSITEKSCSTTGCHTTGSSNAAGGISLSSWKELMEGGNNYNAYVIPFSPDQSPLLYTINTYDEFGPTLVPRMPYNAPAFSRDEVKLFYDWILSRAPNADGEIKFEFYPDQSIIYSLNAQCGLVSLIDVKSGLVMRYIDVSSGGGGVAEVIEVSPDKENYYTLHRNGVLKKYQCSTNAKSGQIELGDGAWRSMAISPDSKMALLADWTGNTDLHGGQIALVDLEMLVVKEVYNISSDSIYFPQGIVTKSDFKTAYFSCGTGNFIYKMNFADPEHVSFTKVLLNNEEELNFNVNTYRPGNIVFSPDESRYFVVCQRSAEVFVFDTETDEVITRKNVGSLPQELVVSKDHNCYFVSCTEDGNSFESGKGSIVIFDLETHEEIKRIYTGYQPKAMVLDKAHNFLYVFNRNADPVGADQPHHFSGCDGNNGYATRIDLSSLELDDTYKVELNVNPYSAAIR